jgi:hypothetical protein
MSHRYALYLGGGMIDGDETSERFMLSARKRKKSKSANYLLSLDEEDMSRNSGNFFGAGKSLSISLRSSLSVSSAAAPLFGRVGNELSDPPCGESRDCVVTNACRGV